MAKRCRNAKGQFKRCAGGSRKRKPATRRKSSCKYGTLKGSARCRKTPKRRRK